MVSLFKSFKKVGYVGSRMGLMRASGSLAAKLGLLALGWLSILGSLFGSVLGTAPTQ